MQTRQKLRMPFAPLLALCLLLPFVGAAQKTKGKAPVKVSKTADAPTSGALLWEVTGGGLTQPSYLFGTFHVLNSEFVATKPTILAKLNASKAVVGELVFDSAAFAKIGGATQLQGTTLDKLLTPEAYQRVDAQLQQVTPYKLPMLNGLSPMAVMSLLMMSTWQKLHPQPETALPMDIYFQQEGRKSGKAVIGLETADEQIDVLFHRIPLSRQAELLAASVKTPASLTTDIEQMSTYYQAQNLEGLSRMMFDASYKPEEMDLLLTARTRAWVAPLKKQFAAQSTFVAVGAGHLVGADGLLTLLRKEGYTVTPVAL
jgi:uncharacterized protein